MDLILKLWLYLAFMSVGGMAYHLWMKRHELSTQKIIFGIMIVLLPFHMFEERIFPGGFHWIYYTAFPGEMVQTQLTMFFCNVPVMIAVFLMFWKLAEKPWSAIFVALFQFFEFAHHTNEAVLTYRMFAEQGMAMPYAPGWITSILQLVVCIIAIVWLIRSKNFSFKNFLAGFLVTAVFAGCFVALPVKLCNDSPYHFPDNGFYEQFDVEDIGTPE